MPILETTATAAVSTADIKARNIHMTAAVEANRAPTSGNVHTIDTLIWETSQKPSLKMYRGNISDM